MVESKQPTNVTIGKRIAITEIRAVKAIVQIKLNSAGHIARETDDRWSR